MFGNNNFIDFYLPSFTSFFNLNMFFINLHKMKPHYFRPDIRFKALYGAFPSSVWNGGRVELGHYEERYMRKIVKTIENFDISLRYTFSNVLITEEILKDPYCNLCLEIADNGKNDVIIVSEILEKYIRKNYPKYGIISSTCKCITDKDELIRELEKDYKMVVLDYNFNNNYEILENLPYKDKCEILVNPVCFPNCSRRKDHYLTLSRQGLSEYFAVKKGERIPEFITFPCKAYSHTPYISSTMSTFIQPDDIWNIYVPMGYRNFKIEGRANSIFNLLENYIYFFVKPECQNEFRLNVLLELEALKIIGTL